MAPRINNCLVCRREFVLKPYEARHTLFCSNECRNTPTFELGLMCRTCGEAIADRDHLGMLRRKRRYCSDECRVASYSATFTGRPSPFKGTGKYAGKPPCPVCGGPVPDDNKRECCGFECALELRRRRNDEYAREKGDIIQNRSGARDREGKRHRRRPRAPDPRPPSLREIARRCKVIRSEWSAEEEQRRLRCDWRTEGWSIPVVHITADEAVTAEADRRMQELNHSRLSLSLALRGGQPYPLPGPPDWALTE